MNFYRLLYSSSYDLYNNTISSDDGLQSEMNLSGLPDVNKWIHYLKSFDKNIQSRKRECMTKIDTSEQKGKG